MWLGCGLGQEGKEVASLSLGLIQLSLEGPEATDTARVVRTRGLIHVFLRCVLRGGQKEVRGITWVIVLVHFLKAMLTQIMNR